MSLKRIITKVDHAKLPDAIKSEYKAEEGTENFVLDLEGYEDPAALKRAKDHERDQNKEARRLLKEAQDQLTALTEERDGLLKGAIPKTDVDKLEGSYKKKLADRETELTDQIGALNSQLQTMLVDNVAQQLAGEISTAPSVIMPHIKSRLKVDKGEDGKFVTKVVDATGAPSALTIADLKKEFVANKDFAPIITGSKATGGGAGGGSGGGGAPTKIDWSKNPTPKEIAAGLRAAGKAPEVPKE